MAHEGIHQVVVVSERTYNRVCEVADSALSREARLRSELERAERECAALRELLSRPYVGAWLDEVLVEAAHQVQRWGATDGAKEPADWFWLLGYLAGKALRAAVLGDTAKARHHTVSAAAALANWAAQISGSESVMRPGLGPEAIARLAGEGERTTAQNGALVRSPGGDS